MKSSFLTLTFVLSCIFVFAQKPQSIKLNAPNMERNTTVMDAFSKRSSSRAFSSKPLNLQDLSDLMWTANGINRQEEGKRTAPSAINAQDIDIYVFMESGVYKYNAKEHQLDMILKGDNRTVFSRNVDDPAPALVCLLVSDISRFRMGSDELKKEWAAMDAGIVSQNISLFCASAELVTRPRAGMNKEKLKELLQFSDTQLPLLNHPVSYKKE